MPTPKWQPGQSGNPAGRPPKSRALTAILERAGSRTLEVDGKPVSRKRLMAELLWQIIETGKAALPNGTMLETAPRDWLETAKWLYGHIDGPPKQGLVVSGDDTEPLRIEHSIGRSIVADEEANRLLHALLWRLASQPGGIGAPIDGGEMDAGEAPDNA